MPVTAGVPRPEDDDLEPVLRDIVHGRPRQPRAGTADHPGPWEFLEIGLRILRDDRERKDRCPGDLTSYLFRLALQRGHLNQMDAASEQLVEHLSLAEFVRLLADFEVRTMLEEPLAGVQTVVRSALPDHPGVREFCRAQLDQLLPRWAKLYEKVATAYGLRLKSSYCWLDIAIIFNAIVEGELARARVTDRPVLSDGSHILGSAIMAMLPTVLDNAPDDLSSCYAVAK